MTGPADAIARRRLGLPTLTALVVANMIGAGVFTTSGFALADLGSPHRVMAAWVCGAVIALCGALSYGALSRHLNASGGEYLFLSRHVHPAAGFVAGWVSLLAGFTGAIAFAALALESYLTGGAGPLAAWPPGTVAVAAVILAGLLHGVRVRPGAWVQNAAVALKLALVVGFIVLAVARGEAVGPGVTAAAPPFSWMAFAGSLVWISLSYSGFNAAVYVAGEAADGRRTVPRSLWLGTLIVALLYLALNAVFMLMAPPAEVVGRPDVAAAAATAIGGPTLAGLVRGVIAMALVTSVSSMMMAGPRVYAQMAADGLFPRAFTRGGESPRAAIALQAACASLVIMTSDLKSLLSYLSFTLSISAALTVVTLFRLRRRESISVVGYPWVPLLYVGATLALAALAAARSPTQLLAFAITVATGLMLYAGLQRR